MSAAEERSSWTLPCHFHTLRLMDCRSRAEAFARSLHSKLKSLGRLTGDVQDEEDDDENGGGVDSNNTFMTSNSVNGCTATHFHNFKEISAPMAVRKSGDERTYLMSAGKPTCHGSPDAALPPKSRTQQQQHQHGEDELYFDFDISSPESPDDPADPMSATDFITRQPTSSMGCSSSDLVPASSVTHLTTAKAECYHIPCGVNTSTVDEESGCISAVSSVMTEQDNNDEDDDEDGDDDIRSGNAELVASELTAYGLVEDNFLYHHNNDICPWDVTVSSSSSSISPPMSCSTATSSCSLLLLLSTQQQQQPLSIVTSQPSLGSPPAHLSSPDLAFNPLFSPNGKLSTIMEQITLEEKENSAPNWQEKPGNAYLVDDDLGQGRRTSDLHSNFECVCSNESNDCVFENFSPTVLMLNDSVSNDFANVNYINGVQNLSVDNGDIESKGCETKSCEDAAVLLAVEAENELSSYSDDASSKVERENGGCGQVFHVDSQDVAAVVVVAEKETDETSICVKEDEEEEEKKEEEEEGRLEGDGKESSLKLCLVRVSPPSSTSSSCCDLTDECVHLDDLDCSSVVAIADSRSSLLPDKTKLTVDVHLLPPGDSDSSKDGDLTPTDEDVPRRVRRSSSLKTGKTPPGTPNRKKIVRFADAMGLDLEAVKTVFLDDLPVVPSSAYFDLEDGAYLDDNEHNFTQSLTIYNSNNRDGNNSMILPPFTSSTSSPKPRCSLVPVFPQPGSLADFMDRIRKQRVCLESAVITGDSNIKLVVRVLNLDFHKCVTVRYTLNEWIDFHEVDADYVPESNDGFSDKFSTVLNARHLQIGERLWFAIRYVTQGREFWDNNHGQNYCFQCFPDQQYSLSPPDDSWIHFM